MPNPESGSSMSKSSKLVLVSFWSIYNSPDFISKQFMFAVELSNESNGPSGGCSGFFTNLLRIREGSSMMW